MFDYRVVSRKGIRSDRSSVQSDPLPKPHNKCHVALWSLTPRWYWSFTPKGRNIPSVKFVDPCCRFVVYQNTSGTQSHNKLAKIYLKANQNYPEPTLTIFVSIAVYVLRSARSQTSENRSHTPSRNATWSHAKGICIEMRWYQNPIFPFHWTSLQS